MNYIKAYENIVRLFTNFDLTLPCILLILRKNFSSEEWCLIGL